MKSLRLVALFCCLLPLGMAHASRIKDISSVEGVRSNQLIGYGLVVGLNGTGDQTTQTPFTLQTFNNMLAQFGIKVPTGGGNVQLKNVAAVSVHAELPPFAKPGQTLDVTISSIGNSKSLRGGTLLMTQLKGADGQTYGIAQGNLVVGGAGASAGGSSAKINQLNGARIPAGATVERAVPTAVGDGDVIVLELKQASFTNAARTVNAINSSMGSIARAMDGSRIEVRAPMDPNARVAFLSRLENLNVSTPAPLPRVVINARTGSVVMNQTVTVEPCAVAHGNLTVTVQSTPVVSQPNAFSQGQTVAGQQASGAFMRLTAHEPLQLVGVRTDASAVSEVHEMTMEGDVMKMRAIPSLDLPVGQTVELKPGVRTMLAKLQAEGARLCLCSNTWSDQCRTVLTRLGIDEYFDFYVEAQGALHKSRPDVFFQTLTRLGGTDPDRCVVCEDSLYAARTAHDAGFRVIGIADAASKSDEPALREVSDQFLTDWTELDWNKV